MENVRCPTVISGTEAVMLCLLVDCVFVGISSLLIYVHVGMDYIRISITGSIIVLAISIITKTSCVNCLPQEEGHRMNIKGGRVITIACLFF